ANSEYSGELINEKINSPCEDGKKFLKNLISGLDIIDIEDENNDNEKTHKDILIDSDLPHAWIDECKQKATSNCNVITDNENFYYCPAFSRDLERFLKTYPLWSCIMINIFGYGERTESSSSVESYFNELKHREMRGFTLPMRVDKFFKLHVDSINAMLKLAVANSEVEMLA
ncbi:hypothetical protein PPYR_00332, partial [Photinus pyralis]